MKHLLIPVIALCFLGTACSSDPQPASTDRFTFDSIPAGQAGLHPDSLHRVTEFLRDGVDTGKIPGSVLTIVTDGSIVYSEAEGMADIEDEIQMGQHHIFRMASMTKPVTSVAVLMLAEEGKLSVNDPVSKFIPEFSEPAILESVDMTDTTWSSRPAENEITLHHLLTHTSGVAYGFIDEELGAVYQKAGVPDGTVMDGRTLEQTMSRLGELPLKHEPGSAWTYGLSTDILGRVVEVASGMPLDRYFQENIFEPLGMHNTGFNIQPEEQERIVALYRNTRPNELQKIPRLSVQSSDTLSTDAGQMPHVGYFSGGSGLLGTAEDYQRFLQTILNGGQLGDVRLFGEETARYLKKHQINDLRLGEDGFSYAFQVTMQDGDLKNNRQPGRLQWGGLFQTHFWLDPARNTTVVLMTQVYPSMHQQELYNDLEQRINRSFIE